MCIVASCVRETERQVRKNGARSAQSENLLLGVKVDDQTRGKMVKVAFLPEAHVFDFPTRPRCVDVHVIVSDAVKGSHIQRSPLSMGGLM